MAEDLPIMSFFDLCPFTNKKVLFGIIPISGHIKSSLPFKHWWNLCVQCGFDWSPKLHSVRCGLSLSDVESRTIEIMAHFIRQKNSRIADARWYKPKVEASNVLFKWFRIISFYPVHFRTIFRLFRRSFPCKEHQPKIRGNPFQWDDLWGSICKLELTGYDLALQILGICWGHKLKLQLFVAFSSTPARPKWLYFQEGFDRFLPAMWGSAIKIKQSIQLTQHACWVQLSFFFSICFPTLVMDMGAILDDWDSLHWCLCRAPRCETGFC